MRVKLCLDSLGPSSRKQKVCFLIGDEDSCKIVSDLAYKIQKRFYKTAGSVSLFLDGFFIPPTESISILQNDDVLTVQ